MTTTLAVENQSSQRKQQFYSQYAHGEISLSEAAKRVAGVTPGAQPRRGYVLLGVATSFLVAFFLPSWAATKKDR